MKPVTPKTLYLALYNFLSAGGWYVCLAACIRALLAGDSPAALWERVGGPLTFVQTAAALEIAHSLLGVTRSPFLGTFLQVMSRLYLVHVCTLRAPLAQQHWSLYLMVASWACVEIPRYLFYTAAQFLPTKDIPAHLFNLRYSLFMVLYPTGITGEMIQMLLAAQALKAGTAEGLHLTLLRFGPDAASPVLSSAFTYRLISFTWLGYLAGGPYMWMNMYGMRKRALRNRARALFARRPEGIQWPVTDPRTGARSSLVTNKQIWRDAFEGLLDAGYKVEARSKLVSALAATKNWRRDYKTWVNRSVVASCGSPDDALAIAKGGLKAAETLFTFVSYPDEQQQGSAGAGTGAGSGGSGAPALVEPLRKAVVRAVRRGTPCMYHTCEVEGQARADFVKAWAAPGGNPNARVTIPYAGKSGAPYYRFKGKAQPLSGDALKAQLDAWVAYGTMERDAADAVAKCVDEPDRYCNLTDETFVILGATSAMGPIDVLLSFGATVVAVDLDRKGTWDKLLDKVRDSPGRMIFPVRKGQDGWAGEDATEDLAAFAGCNLLSHTPQIARWFTQLLADGKVPSDDHLAVGNYTYLDGELHVRLAVACNALIDVLCERNPYCKIAFLCTPTDCHLIPKDAWEAAAANHAAAPWWQRLLAPVTGLRRNCMPPCPDDSGEQTFYMVDGIVPQQGPNYALAKRLQHWMAIAQRAEGHTVASNVAPSTATISVTHNVLFKMAYGGMHYFKPMEVMWPETSNALMGALLLHDLRTPDGPANANTKLPPEARLANPLELFARQGVHGGLWRTGYALNSTDVTSVLAFVVTNYAAAVVAVLAFLVVAFGFLFDAPYVARGRGWDPLARVVLDTSWGAAAMGDWPF